VYREITEFKRGCQPRNNLLKDENGDLIAELFLSVIEYAEPLVPDPSCLEV
jgi:hypothetical protein